MQINNINLPGKLLQDLNVGRWQVGQRLQVEVISHDANQEGLVALNGKLFQAKLEVPVQKGDLFWAAVKAADENGIVLTRETLPNANLTNLSLEKVLTLISRGLPLDQEIYDLITKFPNNKPNVWSAVFAGESPQLKNLISKLLATIPQWQDFEWSKFDLGKFYSNLGLGYERLILDYYKSKQEGQKGEESSVKALLLQIISGKGETLSSEDKAVVQQLLEEITGQQLWIQTGIKNNAYCIMHFPFLDNEVIYDCKLAVESSRKGAKLDVEHCHLSLEVETPNLGLLGADIIIYEKTITISILSDRMEELRPLVQGLTTQTENSFSLLGYNLQSVTCKKFEDMPQFSAFLTGKQLSGVDIKG